MQACFNSLLLNEFIHFFRPTLLTNLNFCIFAVYLAGQAISLCGKVVFLLFEMLSLMQSFHVCYNPPPPLVANLSALGNSQQCLTSLQAPPAIIK